MIARTSSPGTFVHSNVYPENWLHEGEKKILHDLNVKYLSIVWNRKIITNTIMLADVLNSLNCNVIERCSNTYVAKYEREIVILVGKSGIHFCIQILK